MKKLLFLTFLATASMLAKATTFTLVIATTDSAYAHWVVQGIICDSDAAHIIQLGSAPSIPNTVSANATWNSYVISLNVYDSTLTALQTIQFNDKAVLRTDELAVLTSLGYGCGGCSGICWNQWVEVQGNNFPTAWIGFGQYSTYLKVDLESPSGSFPTM